jgi:hypothetical protein
MIKRQPTKRPTKAMTERAFAPYAVEIGHLARSWNQLQETLCLIFTRVVRADNANIGQAVWYALRSDLTQRDVLKAACKALGAVDTRKRPTAVKDIEWILKNTAGLSDQRNTAVHLPFMIGRDTVTKEMVVMPHFFSNNRFSQGLKDKDDVLKELFYCRVQIDCLKDYALAIWFALGHPERQWPSKPSLPTREQVKYPTAWGRKKIAKSLPHPSKSLPPPFRSKAGREP